MLPADWAAWDRQALARDDDPALRTGKAESVQGAGVAPPAWAGSPPESGLVGLVETVAYGWPIRVLRVRGRLFVASDDYSAVTKKETDGLGSFENPWVARPAWGVAWNPIWKPAVVSAMLYGTVLWLLFTALLLVLSWRRVRNGKCIRCGYNLSGIPLQADGAAMCPECGCALV
jgi:hypothetical protein